MKQYLSSEQTAKLIELGLKKPRLSYFSNVILGLPTYTIGELFEMLEGVTELEITRFGSGWGVYDGPRAFSSEELIDALYDMVIMLKEEGVI